MRFGFRGFFLFSVHVYFLSSMISRPFWREISPTDGCFSPSRQPDPPLKTPEGHFPDLEFSVVAASGSGDRR